MQSDRFYYLPTKVNTSADPGQQIFRPGSADLLTKVSKSHLLYLITIFLPLAI